ncbi:NFACT RNA binding domain-containing protein [archaeon]|nr:NFACT RNA binding domain-containing protein [archaeon]
MEVELDLTKSIPENAALYYEQSKKSKKKLEGLREAIQKTKKELTLKQEKAEEIAKQTRKKKREREWYEKYHWFFTTQGLLVLAGRDVKSNQEIVKKHMQSNDLYFHADIHGAPSTVIQSESKQINEKSKEQAAAFAGTYSKAFSAGLETVDVYSVEPNQVKTAAKSGEFLPKGGFVILGQREWYKKTPVRAAVSYDPKKARPIVGPPDSIKSKSLVIAPGRNSKGEIAKKAKAFLEREFNTEISLDEIIQLLPTGGGRVLK